jgi:hypothetical protein
MSTDFITLSPAFNGDSVPLTAGMSLRLPARHRLTERRHLPAVLHKRKQLRLCISSQPVPGLR